jgi:hypothetical protein
MRESIFLSILLGFAILLCYGVGYSDEDKINSSFYQSSLHYTANGMAYWYDKNNGGLESITGVPFNKLNCQHCHASSCDSCHKTTVNGKPLYSTEVAKNQETCLKCHKRIASIHKIDKAKNKKDVHLAKGMQCMSCHTSKDVHGDGTEYKSMRELGAVDITCKKCHQSTTKTASHTVHKEKLTCNACHIRHVVSCTNCHFETYAKEGKKVKIKLSGWLFLMNYNGKVTSANMQTHVAPENKTFLMFAPQNSHSIMKDGRKCNECHATEIVKQVQQGKIDLIWFAYNKLINLKGVIPVVDGVQYNSVYQQYKDGKWIPIENPPAPKIHYAAFGKPLTTNQLRKLSLPVGAK